MVDYTHLTALLAPRPALLTFNAKDNCCFKAGHTLPPLVEAANPVYAMYFRGDVLRTHVNHDPGTHNFERENREALYRMLCDFFLTHQPNVDFKEIPSDKEVKTKEQLHVDLPPGNADFHAFEIALSGMKLLEKLLDHTSNFDVALGYGVGKVVILVEG